MIHVSHHIHAGKDIKRSFLSFDESHTLWISKIWLTTKLSQMSVFISEMLNSINQWIGLIHLDIQIYHPVTYSRINFNNIRNNHFHVSKRMLHYDIAHDIYSEPSSCSVVVVNFQASSAQKMKHARNMPTALTMITCKNGLRGVLMFGSSSTNMLLRRNSFL